MTAVDLKNKFEEETGVPWINSQGEPDIDYVTWLEKNLISHLPLIQNPPPLSKEAQEKHDLLQAQIAWKSNNKLSALTIVRQVYPMLDIFGAKSYCEKHFN